MAKRDYYDVLGVSKSASKDEIRKAFRKLTKQYHPDKHPGDKTNEEKYKEINEAYGILNDDEKRKKYDQFGHAAFDPNAAYGPRGGAGGAGFGGFEGFSGFGGAGGGAGFDFGDLGDIFGDLFGGGRSRGGRGRGGRSQQQANAPQKGQDIRTSINVSFEEAAFGTQKEIIVGIIEPCPDCKGSGAAPGSTVNTCPDCNGAGQVIMQEQTPFGVQQTVGACTRCGGKGKIISTPCNTCKGKGNIRRQHKIPVKVPAGIDNGQSLPLRGKGNVGINGGPPGDIYVQVAVSPSPVFQRDGTTVNVTQNVTFPEAALGAAIEVPTIDGKVKLTIPRGTQPGTKFRLAGKGIPVLNGKGTRGDEFVTVQVTVPKTLNDQQEKELREYAAAMGNTDNLK